MKSSSIPPAADVVPRLALRDPDLWLKAVAWVTIIACALLILTFSFGRDQGIYAVVGDGLLHGQLPYRDLWDFKPPGIFYVYALAQGLFGKNMMAPRLLEVLALFGSVAAMRRLSSHVFEDRTVGLLGGAIAALIHAQLDFWHTGQPETFGAFFTLVGLMLTLEESPQARLVPLAIGLCFGCAALLKPPLGGGALVCAAYLSQRARGSREGWLPMLSPVLWIALGGALPSLICVGWFAGHGAYHDFYWTLGEFTPGYTKLGWEGHRASEMLYHAIEEGFFKFSAVAAAGVVSAIAIQPVGRREREGVFLLLGVIAIHVAGIAMQGKFFAYHYGATLPLIALLAGLGFHKLWKRCLFGGMGGPLAFFSFVAVCVPMRYAVRDLPQLFWERAQIRFSYLLQIPPFDSREAMDRALSYVADYNLSADRSVALEVRRFTNGNDSVFVWGFEPAIYWLSERTPASRFIYNVAQRSPWEADYARRELMRDLNRRTPAMLVVQARDVFPSVTGDALDSRDSLPAFPELEQFLSSNYVFKKSIEDFDVYTLAKR